MQTRLFQLLIFLNCLCLGSAYGSIFTQSVAADNNGIGAWTGSNLGQGFGAQIGWSVISGQLTPTGNATIGIRHAWYKVNELDLINASYASNALQLSATSTLAVESKKPFIIGFWLDANFDNIVNEADRFGWAKLVYDGATIKLQASAVSDSGSVVAGFDADSNANAQPYRTEIYVSGFSSDNVVKFDLESGTSQEIIKLASTARPRGVAVDSLGAIYVGHRGANYNVKRFSPAGVDLGDFTSSIGGYGTGLVSFNGNGDLIVAGDVSSNSAVFRYNGATGNLISTLTNTNVKNVVGMLVHGRYIYAVGYFSANLVRYDLVSGTSTLFVNGTSIPSSPVGMTIGHNGNIFISGSGGIYEFDISTGAAKGLFSSISGNDLKYNPISRKYYVSSGDSITEINKTGSVERILRSSSLLGGYGLAFRNYFNALAVSPPLISAQPNAQQTILLGASVSLSVTASGTPQPTYQWRKNSVDIPGATSSTLTIASAQTADSGTYTCVVTNVAGMVVSDPANLIVNPPSAPQLTLDGLYESAPGASLTVSAIPSAGFPTTFTYQWYFNGFLIPANFGGTASGYTIAGNPANNGSWKVVVTNSAGSVEKTFVYQVFTDTDGDGLSNYRETNILNTNPNLADTDGDTLSDYAEVYTHHTNPLLADEDNDGLDDAEELLAGTITNDSDSDNDGLLDGPEVLDYKSNPLLSDTDGDGLGDYAEVVTYKTNPSKADTDGDGLDDKIELQTYGTNPLRGDSDGDNLLDKAELFTYNSNPLVKDSDGDGSDDGFEVATGYSPASNTSRPDAAIQIQQAVEIKFLAAAGQTYRIEHSDDLSTWTIVESNITGQNGLVRRLYSIEGYQGRFFRVVRQ